MRKTLVYLVVLVLLGCSIWFFLIRGASDPYSITEAGFNIRDTGQIGKLFLASGDGDNVLVERTDSAWMVNKKYKAMPSTLGTLIQTLYEQRALYPVTHNAYENAVKSLATDGIKVEVYDRAGKKMRVFYVGGPSVNGTGTNMLIEGAKTPYVVQVQGFNGYLTPRYTAKVKDWRDRTIVNLPADEVQSVSVQYADKPDNSFVISREGADITVRTDSSISKYFHSLNKRRANLYMKFFAGVSCEGYLNGVDSLPVIISRSHRQSTIDIAGKKGEHQHIDVYWLDINRRSKNMTVSAPDVPDQYDADRMLAVINNGEDTVLIQRLIFKNIFHNSYEFYQEDGTPTVNTPREEKAPRNTIMRKKQ